MEFLLVLLAFFGAVLLLLSAGVALTAYLVAAELRLFLRAPGYYVKKLLGPPTAARRGRRISHRVRELLPQGGAHRQEYLGAVLERVERALPLLESMEKQHERITLYLEYNVYADDLALEVDRDDHEAVRVLEARQRELEEGIETTLASLKKIQNRIATQVLAGRVSSVEGEGRLELEDTLQDLDDLIEADQASGLLPER